LLVFQQQNWVGPKTIPPQQRLLKYSKGGEEEDGDEAASGEENVEGNSSSHLEPFGEAWSHLEDFSVEDDTEEKVGKSLHCFFLISSSMSAKTTSGLKMHILELFMQPEISFGQFQSTGVMQSMQVGD